MAPYAKFFAALVGMALSLIGQITGSDLGVSPELITTIGGALTAVLVFLVPNIDAKGQNAAAAVDSAIRKLQQYANSLPNYEKPPA